ncbi:MAG: hypothetical protein ACI9BW_002816 [Gammaproteobacteria bacterium]|jgi:hypothetical protein
MLAWLMCISRASRPLGRRPETGGTCGSGSCVLALDVPEDFLDHHRVFDTRDDLDGTAAVLANFDVDVTYRDVGQGREQDAEALNTRFKRCAQVIAARRLAGVAFSDLCDALALLPLPRLTGITRARCPLFGAKTP